MSVLGLDPQIEAGLIERHGWVRIGQHLYAPWAPEVCKVKCAGCNGDFTPRRPCTSPPCVGLCPPDPPLCAACLVLGRKVTAREQ